MYASLLAGAVAPNAAHAQGATAANAGTAGTMAHVAVKTIHAKEASEKSTTAPKVTKRLTTSFPPYKTFHVLGSSKWDLAKGKSGKHALPDKKKELAVTYLGPKDKHLKLRVVAPKWKADIRVKDGRTFYQAGTAYKGGILIYSVMAKKK